MPQAACCRRRRKTRTTTDRLRATETLRRGRQERGRVQPQRGSTVTTPGTPPGVQLTKEERGVTQTNKLSSVWFCTRCMSHDRVLVLRALPLRREDLKEHNRVLTAQSVCTRKHNSVHTPAPAPGCQAPQTTPARSSAARRRRMRTDPPQSHHRRQRWQPGPQSLVPRRCGEQLTTTRRQSPREAGGLYRTAMEQGNTLQRRNQRRQGVQQ